MGPACQQGNQVVAFVRPFSPPARRQASARGVASQYRLRQEPLPCAWHGLRPRDTFSGDVPRGGLLLQPRTCSANTQWAPGAGKAAGPPCLSLPVRLLPAGCRTACCCTTPSAGQPAVREVYSGASNLPCSCLDLAHACLCMAAARRDMQRAQKTAIAGTKVMCVATPGVAQNLMSTAQWHSAVLAGAIRGHPAAHQHVQAAPLRHMRPPEVLQRDCAVGADEPDPIVVQHLGHSPVPLGILGVLTNELQEATKVASACTHCPTS